MKCKQLWKGRETVKVDYLYGIHPVREGLRGRRQPLELFVDEKQGGQRVEELVELARERGIPVRQRQRQDLERITPRWKPTPAGSRPAPKKRPPQKGGRK